VTRHKEITVQLLDAYGFEYEVISGHFKSLIGKLVNLPKTDLAILKIAKKFKPDILMGILDMYNAHVGSLIGKPCVTFTDTEHAKLGNLITLPFVNAVITPSTFTKDLGSKHIRYNGYHELAYLHPNYFKPDPSVLDELGLSKNDRIIILRFVAFDAGHDKGYEVIDFDKWYPYVNEFENYGHVYITSENKLQSKFKKYGLGIPPQKIHDLLAFTTMYIGSGATMATESAILGTPSIYISPLAGTMGNLIELEKKYKLLYSYKSPFKGLKNGIQLLKNDKLKENWKDKQEKLLQDKIDVTTYLINLIEKYPVSLGQ
jgi:predicted glycosyltransferase